MIFAHRLIARATEMELLPQEFYAMKGKCAKEAIITQTLWTDTNRLQHRSFAVVSADLSQCFDLINHPQCSLAFQAFGCPIQPIKIMLLTLQTMNFWIRSAYGDASTPFGGTAEKPFMGMGQGSGGSNPGCTLTFAPLVAAYKKRDYHSNMTCAYSGLILSLAAIIYVDDTDLLLRSKKHHSHEEFFSFIQDALNFWGMLVLATGGVLKQKKSRVAVALFKFSDGRARLLQPRAFPKLQFQIPQKGNTSVPIPTVGPDKDIKSLGFTNDLRNSGKHQVKQIEKMGKEWVTNMNTSRYLRRGDVRLSLSSQLRPKLNWSIACLSSDPKKLDETVHGFFYNSMSRMGCNRNMRREMRQLPKKYGGLGYFDLNIDNLGDRFHFIA